MKNRIIVAAILVPLLVIVLFVLPPGVLVVAVALVCVLSTNELLNAVLAKEYARYRIYAVFSSAFIPIGAFFGNIELVFTAALLVLMCIMTTEAIITRKKTEKNAFIEILYALFGGAVMPLMLSTIVSMRNMQEGRLIVMLPAISAFITDTGSYLTGMYFGKRKAFPSISPKKTIEGYIGGFVSCVLTMIVYGIILDLLTPHRVAFWAIILCGVVGALATQLGDLAFSLVKREYNLKDYGRLLPGHGGMLDRFDSMVFSAPAIYLLVTIVPVIT